MRPVIAIDGPAGSGKSTVAKEVANRLSLSRLDTGAMYRAVSLLVLRSGADPSDEAAAADLARSMALEVGDHEKLNGDDVTHEIRAPEVDAVVSAVSAHPSVRAELVRRQREWGDAHDGGVVEGRDIGSVVFPDADLKIFLTADRSARARRRVEQRASQLAGMPSSEADAQADLARRDGFDSSRAVSPLQVAEGAIVVDSTDLSVDDVVKEVLSHL